MFTLAHLSDPHIGPLPEAQLRELASKRMIGYVNWHRNRAPKYRPHILLELVEAIHAAGPEHITVTGDLVNIALPTEISVARAWLETIGKPDRVTVIPGNHDAYVPGALEAAIKAWHPFMEGDNGAVTFPFVRRRGPIALVGLSTARASPPLFATGTLGAAQSKALGETLHALGEEGLFRVVLIHHPVIEGETQWHRRLTDARAFRRVIAAKGAELILHGHNHLSSVGAIDGPGGPVAVVGVPSASNSPGGRRHPGAAFNLYRIDGTRGAFTCSMSEFGFTEKDKPIQLIGERRLLG